LSAYETLRPGFQGPQLRLWLIDAPPGAILSEVLSFSPAWLPIPEADALLAELTATLPLRQETVVLWGRAVPQPRLSLWMGDPVAIYRYSGCTFVPVRWHERVLDLRWRLERETGQLFNSVLLNLYRDGRDSMGFHADDEPELGQEPVIASVSLGVTRRLVLRPRRKRGSTSPRELALTHGSLLVMSGASQRDWVHAVPKELRVSEARLNLTFRRVLSRSGS
jgi:alkylated DNA repair dioxygenase AlkB